jgi:hypothetical protein
MARQLNSTSSALKNGVDFIIIEKTDFLFISYFLGRLGCSYLFDSIKLKKIVCGPTGAKMS